MKYNQSQIIKHLKEFGLKSYYPYVNEALGYYNKFMMNYLNSIGTVQLFVKYPKEETFKDAHEFALAATGLVYPPILCDQIDIYFSQANIRY